MIKVQDFARECGVTDRQIHRLLSKYQDEVEGHFDRQGQNGTWLDEVACQILRSKMKKLPPAVSDQQTLRDLKELQEENVLLNKQLGAQGIIIGNMQKKIDELQQFQIDTIKEQRRLEESKAAQERREQELAQREEQMAQELAEAAQKAAEDARAAEEAKYAHMLTEAEQAAQKELTAAQGKLERKDALIEDWKKYAADLEAYNRRFFKRKKDKPVPPVVPTMQEE